MSFRKIKNQDGVIERFRNAVENDRIAGAYIFAGPEGVGKLLFAKELARYLFCKNRNDDSCGECSSCRKMSSGSYPDFSILAALPEEKDIKIEYVRELQRQLYLKPLEGNKKIFIVNDAHKLNDVSSNCLLKSFEEPPGDSIIILITHNLSGILPTIQSRAVIVRFRPIEDKTIKKILVADKSISSDDASFITAVSAGSLSKAFSLAGSDFKDKRAWLNSNILAIRKNNNFDLTESLLALCKSADSARQQLREAVLEMLDMMLLFFRWMLMTQRGNGKDTVFEESPLSAACKILSQRDFEKIIIELLDARRHIDLNANISMTLEIMFHRIGEIEESGRWQEAILSDTAK